MVREIEGESGGIFAGPERGFESTWSRLGGLFLLVEVEGADKVSGMMSQNVVGKGVEFLDFFIVFTDDEGSLSFKEVIGEIVDLGIDGEGGKDGIFYFWFDKEVADVGGGGR